MSNAPKSPKSTKLKKASVKSIETNTVSQWASPKLKNLGWKCTFESGELDKFIAKALRNAPSKSGGTGGCKVDAQLLLDNGAKQIPVMIEYKGKKGDLVKLDDDGLVRLKNDKNEFEFNTVINKYAVNGAAYYANVVLEHTDFDEVLAVGVNGYVDSGKNVIYEVQAYLMTKDNPNTPIKLHFNKNDTFTNFDFLDKTYVETLFQQIEDCKKSPTELAKKHIQDENRLDKVLKALNQHLRDETRISVTQRIAIVTPCIMAGLGVKKKDGTYEVAPLSPKELTGSTETGNTDGDKIFNKVSNFLKALNIPASKIEQIENSLRQALLYSRLSEVENLQSKSKKEEQALEENISPLKSAYTQVYENVIPAYHLSGVLDFTGKLFNVMNDWVAVPDGDANDVVLTPRYVTDLMAKLAKVNQDSFVWDWALGSGGFLISAMNLMLADAKKQALSPKELAKKQAHIKANQLLGIEKLPEIYILAVLNMILMGDGSSGILNQNSLVEFDGKVAYSTKKNKPAFKANVFLLNPPYSAEGNGMIFVQKAFQKMKSGRGVVIIQDSAGTGKAKELNKSILKNNKLLASIKMPADLFKASVQTSIYLFEVGTAHQKNDNVKFIDFSNDGYKRTNRKKASTNLVNQDHAHERYAELVDVINNDGIDNANYFTKGKNYILDTIDPTNGCDWNFTQHKKVELQPSLNDFKKTVSDYLAWEVSQLLKNQQPKKN